jgi:hypothetical protein
MMLFRQEKSAETRMSAPSARAERIVTTTKAWDPTHHRCAPIRQSRGKHLRNSLERSGGAEAPRHDGLAPGMNIEPGEVTCSYPLNPTTMVSPRRHRRSVARRQPQSSQFAMSSHVTRQPRAEVRSAPCCKDYCARGPIARASGRSSASSRRGICWTSE